MDMCLELLKVWCLLSAKVSAWKRAFVKQKQVLSCTLKGQELESFFVVDVSAHACHMRACCRDVDAERVS